MLWNPPILALLPSRILFETYPGTGLNAPSSKSPAHPTLVLIHHPEAPPACEACQEEVGDAAAVVGCLTQQLCHEVE